MRRIPFHPILFAIFPVVSLYARNVAQLPFQVWVQPTLGALGLALLSWFLASLWLKDGMRSGLLASVLLVLFFSFGPVLNGAIQLLYSLPFIRERALILDTLLGREIWAGFCLVLFGITCYLVHKLPREPRLSTEFLNVFGIALITIVVMNWSIERMSDRAAFDYSAPMDKSIDSVHSAEEPKAHSDPMPDMYYIILDGYGRADILNSLYSLDNSSFYSFLADKGFYLASQSHSNYMQTPLSLASSLNSTYLDSLARQVGDQSDNRIPLGAMIENNELFDKLRDRGYSIVTLSSGFDLTEIKNSDVYLSPSGDIDAFGNALLDTTPLPLVLHLPFLKSQYELHRERILFSFDHLADLPDLNGPKLVFCHILAPHPPFVFGPDGESVEPEISYDLSDGSSFMLMGSNSDYVQGYRNQLSFVTERVKIMLAQILARSRTPPVIVIQGDHGPGSRLDWASAENTFMPERMSILNAYFFPDHNYSALYAGITPVNSFGVVLNQFFGGNYPVLPDRSFYSTLIHPYAFVDVTDRLSMSGQP